MPTAIIDQFDELPRIKGPKLQRFKNGHYKRLEYLELLGRSDDQEQLPNGDHGYVFKVRIDGGALRTENFSILRPGRCSRNTRSSHQKPGIPGGHRGPERPILRRMSSLSTYRVDTTKKPIAISCHGFISIPAKQESFFAQNFNITDWNRPEEELSIPPAKRQPLRALVKDLVETDPEITMKLIASIRRELKALNNLRIYVMDVRWSNYKGGHLVDFSSAWTEPHFEFRKDVSSEEDIKINRQIDLAAFNKMVKEELGMDMSMRTEPNPDFIMRLRPRRRKQD